MNIIKQTKLNNILEDVVKDTAKKLVKEGKITNINDLDNWDKPQKHFTLDEADKIFDPITGIGAEEGLEVW